MSDATKLGREALSALAEAKRGYDYNGSPAGSKIVYRTDIDRAIRVLDSWFAEHGEALLDIAEAAERYANQFGEDDDGAMESYNAMVDGLVKLGVVWSEA